MKDIDWILENIDKILKYKLDIETKIADYQKELKEFKEIEKTSKLIKIDFEKTYVIRFFKKNKLNNLKQQMSEFKDKFNEKQNILLKYNDEILDLSFKYIDCLNMLIPKLEKLSLEELEKINNKLNIETKYLNAIYIDKIKKITSQISSMDINKLKKLSNVFNLNIIYPETLYFNERETIITEIKKIISNIDNMDIKELKRITNELNIEISYHESLSFNDITAIITEIKKIICEINGIDIKNLIKEEINKLSTVKNTKISYPFAISESRAGFYREYLYNLSSNNWAKYFVDIEKNGIKSKRDVSEIVQLFEDSSGYSSIKKYISDKQKKLNDLKKEQLSYINKICLLGSFELFTSESKKIRDSYIENLKNLKKIIFEIEIENKFMYRFMSMSTISFYSDLWLLLPSGPIKNERSENILMKILKKENTK